MDYSNTSTTQSKRPSKKNNPWTWVALVAAGLACGTLLFLFTKQQNLQTSIASAEKVELSSFPITIPTIKYGFAIDTFQVVEDEIKSNQFLGDILSKYGVDYVSIEQLVQNAKPVFDIRHIRVGKPYMILAKDTTQRADYFIYEPSVYEYYVFHLKDDLKVEHVERPVTTEIQTMDGTINASLWQTMVDNGVSYELTAKMEDALQWSVDFYHVQKGDHFELIYEQNYIEGQKVGVGQVKAAHYTTGPTQFQAYWYENEKFQGYYDEKGRPMKKTFLKAPVKYSRISSKFNMNRFHPILKRRKPHLGTDYAAPYGTPIYAVADGVVTKANYTKGNGRFVKIKHDKKYQTQYLHMQGFAEGIKSGVHVKQGQVIGYVGSTGLATGPHVCFRFWMDGKQVNHLKLNFPEPDPLPEEELPAFNKIRDSYLTRLAELGPKPAVTAPAGEEETPKTEEEQSTSSLETKTNQNKG